MHRHRPSLNVLRREHWVTLTRFRAFTRCDTTGCDVTGREAFAHKTVHGRGTCRRLPVIPSLTATIHPQRQPFLVQRGAKDKQTHVVAVLPVSVSYNATFAVNQVNVRGGIESPQTAATSQNISLITAFRAGESSVSWGYCRFENCQTSKKKTNPTTKVTFAPWQWTAECRPANLNGKECRGWSSFGNSRWCH